MKFTNLQRPERYGNNVIYQERLNDPVRVSFIPNDGVTDETTDEATPSVEIGSLLSEPMSEYAESDRTYASQNKPTHLLKLEQLKFWRRYYKHRP
jgi:hypothetical protein